MILLEDIPLCLNTHNETICWLRQEHDIGILIRQHVSVYLDNLQANENT
jgi:hypothetical protein